MSEVEGTIAELVHARNQEIDPQMPPGAGPRALLKARLAEMASQPGQSRWPRLRLAAAIYASGALALMVAGALAMHERTAPERFAVPRRTLTPGAIRTAAARDVCMAQTASAMPSVPAPLRRRVFEEYGIPNAPVNLYEVDYLITPELGGAADLRNLWPEPYSRTVWNARVKDALEDRLHGMVCEGKIGLTTAQREISTDWIAAYKKYFHTSRPLAIN